MRGGSPINNFSFLYKYKLIISILVIFLLIGTVSAAADNATVVSDTIPSTMNTSQSYTVSITMKNDGTKIWNETYLYRLGTVGDGAGDAYKFVGDNRLHITGDVNPGSSYTFTFIMTAPVVTGSYTPQFEMVHDAVAWFGQILTHPIQVDRLVSPVPVFTANVTSGIPLLPVLFTDTSINATRWSWFFGDETYNQSWTQKTASAGWTARFGHAGVTMPDGSIIIMGGTNGSDYKSDVWRSTNNGATWNQMNASAAWGGRVWYTTSTVVSLSDGSIVLTGGGNATVQFNDVWRSVDNGVIWIRQNASAGWAVRLAQQTVAMPDGSIILTGGVGAGGLYNDTWRSTDKGVTWVRQNASSGWSARQAMGLSVMPDGSIILTGGTDNGSNTLGDTWRSTNNGVTWTRVSTNGGWIGRMYHTSVAMPDGSIVILGGFNQTIFSLNDVWRSTNNGATWTQINASAGWVARRAHVAVVIPNGSIVVIGGLTNSVTTNDVWLFDPASSSLQSPVHTYPLGFYSVSLQASNSGGYNRTIKNSYISVVPVIASFKSNTTRGASSFPVQFNDTSIGLPIGWSWLFGDEVWSPALWTQQNASSGWSKRYAQSAVALPDGSIVLMGGFSGIYRNDVWRSTNKGITWTQQTSNAAWIPRFGQISVALPDGSIIMIGGYNASFGFLGDVWRSTDKGVSWEEQNASSGVTRLWHNGVALSDGSIVVVGGYAGAGYYNDTWRSTNQGVTWTLINASSGWTPRVASTSVAMPDGSIILFGGADGITGVKTDSWRSTDKGYNWVLMNASTGILPSDAGSGAALFDNSMIFLTGYTDVGGARNDNETWRTADGGATWTRLNESSGWSERRHASTVATSDGIVITMGGYDMSGAFNNDTWKFNPPITSTQNPLHTYSLLGTYNVALQAYNASGFSSSQQPNLINVYSKPVSNFTGVAIGAIPFNDSFTDLSSNITAWAWFFGDELYNQAWVYQGNSAPLRYSSNFVTLPNGNIVMMGGHCGGWFWNDVWYSTNKGGSFTTLIDHAGWSDRSAFSSVVLSDGAIVVMGGTPDDATGYNDVWISINGGSTWTQQNASAGWVGRFSHTSVVLPDGSIVIMGGYNSGSGSLSDVWRSTDRGVTWIRQTANIGMPFTWAISGVLTDGTILLTDGTYVYTSADKGVTWTLRNSGTGGQVRLYPAGVAMSDNSFVMFVGSNGGYITDVWRTIDYGVTWTQINPSAGWYGRFGGQIAVTLPDGSVVLGHGTTYGYGCSGDSNYRASWRFQPSGSIIQNPSHIYTSKGNYSVSLLTSSVNNYNTTWRLNYTQVYNQSFSNFIANVTIGVVPLPVQFNATSTNSTGWAWFFGDETFTQTWSQINSSAGWVGRYEHETVVLPDGSLVIMGGDNGMNYLNDVWRSIDKGVTWVQQNASAGWTRRAYFGSAVTANGSILVMGGSTDYGYANDTWMSVDKGVMWTRINASGNWLARFGLTAVTSSDGSVILMGGVDSTGSARNDTWKSTDNGATWTLVNASSGWQSRWGLESVTLVNGGIEIMGGQLSSGSTVNDVWKSTNNGVTWTQMTPSAGWSGRRNFAITTSPDGSILLIGGNGGLDNNEMWRSTNNGMSWSLVQYPAFGGVTSPAIESLPDGSLVEMGGYNSGYTDNVWRMQPVGSSIQNATHIYTSVQRYNVSLVSSNYASYNNTQKNQYIDVGVLPIASFSASESSGFNGYITQYIQFTNTSINAPTYWNWSFRDVTGNNTEVWFSQAQNILYSFKTTGNYTIKLKVSNSYGYNISPDNYWINLSNPITPPVAQFSGTPVLGPPPLSVLFTDASFAATGWAWFFGDGTYNQSWNNITLNPGWQARFQHSTIALHDGEIILTGGTNGTRMNDTWKSIDYGKTWTLINASSGWTARQDHLMVLMQDGSIVLMGGVDSSGNSKNDTWRTTDEGITWTLMNSSSGWFARFGLSGIAVQNPSNSIIIMGGSNGTTMNDTWQSTDYGATWIRMSTSSGWLPRYDAGSVVMQDSSIVLMGGISGTTYFNDVWMSTDKGITWNQVSSALWAGRTRFTTARLPDNSIVIMGGAISGSMKNDVWRSTDKGITWNQVNASAGWSVRSGHTSVVMPNASVLVMGGFDGSFFNDTWLFNPVGATIQNPSHLFMNSGYYDISMRAYNFNGYNTTVKPSYINVIGATAAFNATPNPAQLGTPIVFVDMSSNSPTSWNWSLGDGNYSNSRNIAYIYPTIGEFTVRLNASNIYGFSNASQNITIYPSAPVANFTIDHNIGASPLAVQFTDTSGAGITSWFWNFDDGSTSTSQNPSHTYLTLGTYHAQLTVWSSVGTNVSQPVTIYVVNSAVPIADFAGAPTLGSAPLSVQFTDLSVALSGVNAWNWSFGDGNYSNVQNPVHIYSSGGQYTVMLTAISGAFSNYTAKAGYINIGVPSSSVSANFNANATYAAQYPATIQFYDSSVCNPVCTNWAWDLNGDGATDAMIKNPTYTYTYPGNYSPKLVVSNGINSGTKIRNQYIIIGPIFVQPTIPQPTNAWIPGYQYNGSIWEFKGTSYVDLPNSTFLKYWLQNFTATGNFSVYGFATGLMAPIMHVFGFWIFLIVWGLYLFAVWIRAQDVTLPLIIGILTMGTFGLLFPKESLPVIIIMFVICGGIIITKLMKDSI